VTAHRQAPTVKPLVLVTSTTEVIRGVSRVRANEAYTDALTAVGLLPVVLPPIDPALAVEALDQAAGLVLTGGDAYELALARAAAERRLPTLAICRGIQLVNVAFGGTLVQDIPSQRPAKVPHDPGKQQRTERIHHVTLDPASRIARVVGEQSIETNSSHHQAVDRLAPSLRITGRTEDGIIEAVEPKDTAWWMIGVQWHPEELTATAEDWDRRLFSGFADAVRSSGASEPRLEPAALAAPASGPPGRTASRSRR